MASKGASKKQEHLHPGQILLEQYLEPNNITQGKFSAMLKWKLTRLNKLINGKGGITAQSAIDLAKATDKTPEQWLNLQMMYDLGRAREVRRESWWRESSMGGRKRGPKRSKPKAKKEQAKSTPPPTKVTISISSFSFSTVE